MIIYGYARDYKYTGDGTLLIQVRIPSVHGPYNRRSYDGKPVRNYTEDENLPYYPSLLLPHLPAEGEVVALCPLNNGNSQFIIIGLTGGSHQIGLNNSGG